MNIRKSFLDTEFYRKYYPITEQVEKEIVLENYFKELKHAAFQECQLADEVIKNIKNKKSKKKNKQSQSKMDEFTRKKIIQMLERKGYDNLIEFIDDPNFWSYYKLIDNTRSAMIFFMSNDKKDYIATENDGSPSIDQVNSLISTYNVIAVKNRKLLVLSCSLFSVIALCLYAFII